MTFEELLRDTQFDVFTNGSPHVAVVATHIPTGTTVRCEGIGRHKTKWSAIDALRFALAENDK